MNIYIVKRDDGAGYDEYESFVIVAANGTDAVNIAAKFAKEHNLTNQGKWTTATLIGKASKRYKITQIIHTHFYYG